MKRWPVLAPYLAPLLVTLALSGDQAMESWLGHGMVHPGEYLAIVANERNFGIDDDFPEPPAPRHDFGSGE